MKQKNKIIKKSFFSVFLNNNGFGLIEVTVSIYIITMGLLGLMSLVLQNLQVQHINKNSIIASQLAQEGIELVRNVRDNNWRTEGSDWKDDIYTELGENNYIIDYRGRTSIQTGLSGVNDSNARLYIHNSGANEGFYTHSTNNTTETFFYRIINVEKYANIYLTIKSIIYWEERGRPHKYIVETKLYNWKFPE